MVIRAENRRRDVRDDPHDNGSDLLADPSLQFVKEQTARDLTQEVRGVYEVEKKSDNWKEEAVNALIILAVAITLIAIGHGIGFALGIGIALAAYGVYKAFKAGQKWWIHREIIQVHEDAATLRISKVVKEGQDKREAAFGQQGAQGRQRLRQRPAAYAPGYNAAPGFVPAYAAAPGYMG